MTNSRRTKAVACLRPMTNAQYVRSKGLRCPFCRSSCVEAPGSVDVDEGRATQEMGCNNCGRYWNDVYTLVSYEAIVEGSTPS